MGLYDKSAIIYHTYRKVLFLKEEPPPRMDFLDQLSGYLANVEFIFSGTIPFDKDTDVNHYFMYDDHQWTIPKEFRSSMVVFAVLVTTSRMRSILRMATIFILCVYAIYTARLYTSLFFAGMLLAEFDLVRQAYYARTKDNLPEFSTEKPRGRLYTIMHFPVLVYKVMWASFFILGVYMISSPQEIQKTPNYLPLQLHRWGVRTLDKIDNSLLVVGSILTVWSVAACPSLGPLFNNPFVAYLGKISYALYLVHGTVIKSLGYSILPWTLRLATWTPEEVPLDKAWWLTVSSSQKVAAHLLGWLFVGTTCFWLSDLFWRFVDIPCVSFARKVEGLVTKGADSDESMDEFNSGLVAGRELEHRRRAASVGLNGAQRVGSHLPGFDPKRKNG
jgi:peptidoglycan/LPS O-acetylase OafA/YrhL